ncbi:MAG: hypothetical protein WC450_02660 [Candidatus Omnitrophota bacterium]
MIKKNLMLICGLILLVGGAGCSSNVQGNTGQLSIYNIPVQEAKWIRDGEPMEFEGELWYPQDAMDVLLDSEVLLLGECQGVQIFVDKIDVRPFRALYTKFGKNKFRIFKKQVTDD